MEDLTQLVKEAEALGCRAGLADVAQVSFEPAFRDACASNWSWRLSSLRGMRQKDRRTLPAS